LKGQFAEALEYRRRGHELGSKIPRWPYPSAQWVRNCERLVEIDAKLRAILSGQKQPADTAERLALAQLCQLPCKKQYAAAVRFYQEAFAAEPKLANDLSTPHRYNAACAAALAAAGQGKDADKLESKERSRWRRQALDWLRADLTQWSKQMEKGSSHVQTTLKHWQQNPDLASVRDEANLAKLPTEEQPGWRQLWAGVKNTLTRIRPEINGKEKSAKK
jgi:serine/threonine-protein kinase